MFFAIISSEMQQSSCQNIYVNFRLICETFFTEMRYLNQNEKVTCEDCGTEATKAAVYDTKKGAQLGLVQC